MEERELEKVGIAEGKNALVGGISAYHCSIPFRLPSPWRNSRNRKVITRYTLSIPFSSYDTSFYVRHFIEAFRFDVRFYIPWLLDYFHLLILSATISKNTEEWKMVDLTSLLSRST